MLSYEEVFPHFESGRAVRRALDRARQLARIPRTVSKVTGPCSVALSCLRAFFMGPTLTHVIPLPHSASTFYPEHAINRTTALAACPH